MSEFLTDYETIMEARGLRFHVSSKVNDWNTSVKWDMHSMNAHLSELLKCHDPEFQFYVEEPSIVVADGVEQHVYEGLKVLNGPYGYTYYKMLLAKKNNLQE